MLQNFRLFSKLSGKIQFDIVRSQTVGCGSKKIPERVPPNTFLLLGSLSSPTIFDSSVKDLPSLLRHTSGIPGSAPFTSEAMFDKTNAVLNPYLCIDFP